MSDTNDSDGVSFERATTPPLPPLPPPGPQASYVPPGYQLVPNASMRRSTNGFAIASLVLGIIWIYWLGSILALIFGYIAKRQIRDSHHQEGGDGLATAGIVLGWVGVAFLVLTAVLLVAVNATNGGSSG